MLPVMFLFLILGMLISYIIMIHFKKKKEVGSVNIWEFHSPNVWIWEFLCLSYPCLCLHLALFTLCSVQGEMDRQNAFFPLFKLLAVSRMLI